METRLQEKKGYLGKQKYGVDLRINTLHNVCAVHWGVQYNRGHLVHQSDIMSTVGGFMSKLGGFSTPAEYHESTG